MRTASRVHGAATSQATNALHGGGSTLCSGSMLGVGLIKVWPGIVVRKDVWGLLLCCLLSTLKGILCIGGYIWTTVHFQIQTWCVSCHPCRLAQTSSTPPPTQLVNLAELNPKSAFAVLHKYKRRTPLADRDWAYIQKLDAMVEAEWAHVSSCELIPTV